MGSNFYRGLYMFFCMGAIISFLPTILLAWDMESILWQISIASFLANAGTVILLAILDGLYQSSKNFAPATILTFSGLATGSAIGLFIGGVFVDFWYFAAVPAALAILSGIISGSGEKTAAH